MSDAFKNLPDLWFKLAFDTYKKQREKSRTVIGDNEARDMIYATYRVTFTEVARAAHAVSPKGEKALALDSKTAGDAVTAYLRTAPVDKPFRDAVQTAFDQIKGSYAMVSQGNPSIGLGVLKASLPAHRLALN